MYIGEVSKRTGLSIKAIRLYEELGLIKPPDRVGRYRVFKESDIELLILIKEAKAFGVTLAQLKNVINYNNGQIDWVNIKEFLRKVRTQLVHQIDDIHHKIKLLDECYVQINT